MTGQGMSEDRVIVQVSGRPTVTALGKLATLDPGLRVSTVLSIAVRDDAALQGALHRFHDLGLALVQIHTAEAHGDLRVMEAEVTGSLGDTALHSLNDHVDVRMHGTRLTLSDPNAMNATLTILLSEGLAVQSASPH